jgi:hypothetical protein
MKSPINFKSVSCSVLLAAAALVWNAPAADATYPANYYDSLEGKCGVELMSAIKSLVRNHTVISYGNNNMDSLP